MDRQTEPEDLTEKSLSREKPWDLNKYNCKSSPDGWEWNAKSGRWNQPPKNWHFNGRYWVRMSTCKLYLKGECKDREICQKYHPELPWLDSAGKEEAKMAEENKAENETSSNDLLQASVEALLAFKGSRKISDQIAEINRRTEVFRDHGQDLGEKCGHMSMVILGKEGFDYVKRAELYHNYINALGYFPNGSKYVHFFAESHCRDFSCVDKALLELESGTLLIEQAEKLCSRGRKTIRSIQKSCKRLILVFAFQSREIPESLDDILNGFPLERIKGGRDRLQLVIKALLECVKTKFKGAMKFEGGPDGPYVRLCARRILKDCGKDINDIANGIVSAFYRICTRQLQRLTAIPNTDMKEWKGETRKPDNLLLTEEDLLGPTPNVSKFQVKEWDELQGMIGLNAVKLSIRSLIDGLLVNYYRELNEQEPLQISLSRLFLGPPGTGKTTVAKLYGKILAELGYLSSGELVVKSASDFIGRHVGESVQKTKKIFEEARGNVLLIDEAYMLNAQRNHNCPFRQEVTDTIVCEVQNKPGENLCVIMCGYKNHMEEYIRGANPGLQRRFPIDEAFVFEDFNEEQLGKIFDLKMQEQNLGTTKEGRAVAMNVLKLAKQRPNFGNGGEVDKIISRAISNFRKRFIKIPSDMRLACLKVLLSEDDFDPEHSRSLHAEDEVGRQFEDLIGLDSQIDVFRRLARQVKAMTKHKLDPKPFIPFTFVIKGPPGSGKTTVARKIGNLYYQMGLLATSEVVEASVQDMIARYTGQTATKTRKLIESALGKVLFIDEAYRLTGERKALDELVDALTKPYFMGKVVIILAGYESHMTIMLQANPGLSSRFRTHIQFTNLSGKACTLLLKKRIEENRVTAAFDEQQAVVERMFESLSSIDGWGNGRDVESMAREIVCRVFENMTDDSPTANSVLVLDVMQDWHTRQGRPVCRMLVNPSTDSSQNDP